MREMIVVYFVFIISALFLAQPVGRFYVEIFIWMLFFSILYTNDVRGFLQNIFTKTLLAYSFCFVIILGYFSLNLFSGNISQKLNDKILLKNADGYSLSKWANEVIPDNSVIISAHRSKTFYKHEVVSYEFRLFGGLTKREVSYYLNEMAKKKPKYILYKSSEINTNNDYLQNCRGKLFKFKKNVGYIAGRNPFTTSKKFYDGYIYEISDTKIKDCIK